MSSGRAEIYLPEDAGVRIEDLVLVTDDGCERLTEFTKELLVVQATLARGHGRDGLHQPVPQRMHIELGGSVWRIVEFQHVKPGKGGAFVRTKLKALDSGAVVDRTFRAGEKFARIPGQNVNSCTTTAPRRTSWTRRPTTSSGLHEPT
jgi:hypothetical protein